MLRQNIKIKIFQVLPVVVVGVLLVTGILYAWTEPTVAPPGNTVSAPLNVSGINQVKQGGLGSMGNMAASGFCLPGSSPTGGCIYKWPSGSGGITSVSGPGGSATGPVLTFNGAGVTQSGNTFTFSGGGGGGGGVSGSGTLNKVPKWTGATLLGDSQIFDNGTNVGINTTNPQTKLFIEAGSSVGLQISDGAGHYLSAGSGCGTECGTGIRIGTVAGPDAAGAGGTGGMLYYTYGTNNLVMASTYGIRIASRNGNIQFNTSNGGADTERMRIDTAGNVGIGTTNPGTRLEVAGHVRALGDGTNSLFLANSGSVQKGWFGYYGPENVVGMYRDDGGAYVMLGVGGNVGIGGGGSVGIGARAPFNPADKLAVAGGHISVYNGDVWLGAPAGGGPGKWASQSGGLKAQSGMMSIPARDPLTNDPRTISVSFTPVGAMCSPARDTYTGGWSHTWCFANSISLGSNSVTFNNMGCNRTSGTCEINYIIFGN